MGIFSIFVIEHNSLSTKQEISGYNELINEKFIITVTERVIMNRKRGL